MSRTVVFVFLAVALAWSPCWGAPMKSIGKDKVNVRNGPGLTNDVLFQAHLGYPIEVEKRKGDWVYFKDWQGDTGWVYRPLVKNIQTAVVLKDQVNVRKGPGIRYKVVTKVSKGEVYKIFRQKKNWVKIGYYLEGEEIGWIRGDLVWGD
jgi:uncharacterized protein YgiM (DUF1202 family)